MNLEEATRKASDYLKSSDLLVFDTDEGWLFGTNSGRIFITAEGHFHDVANNVRSADDMAQRMKDSRFRRRTLLDWLS